MLIRGLILEDTLYHLLVMVWLIFTCPINSHQEFFHFFQMEEISINVVIIQCLIMIVIPQTLRLPCRGKVLDRPGVRAHTPWQHPHQWLQMQPQQQDNQPEHVLAQCVLLETDTQLCSLLLGLVYKAHSQKLYWLWHHGKRWLILIIYMRLLDIELIQSISISILISRSIYLEFDIKFDRLRLIHLK